MQRFLDDQLPILYPRHAHTLSRLSIRSKQKAIRPDVECSGSLDRVGGMMAKCDRALAVRQGDDISA